MECLQIEGSCNGWIYREKKVQAGEQIIRFSMVLVGRLFWGFWRCLLLETFSLSPQKKNDASSMASPESAQKLRSPMLE